MEYILGTVDGCCNTLLDADADTDADAGTVDLDILNITIIY